MTSDNKCALCLIFKEVDNLVDQNEFAYAAVPNDPLFEGHVMVLPKRHTILDDLTPEELGGIHKLTTKLKKQNKEIIPRITSNDTLCIGHKARQHSRTFSLSYYTVQRGI